MLLEEVLINREKVFAFKWPECRQFHGDVSPPIIISTMLHKAWQAVSFPILKALLPLVIIMFKERLDREVLEYYNKLYRNTWFLVKKKKLGEY